MIIRLIILFILVWIGFRVYRIIRDKKSNIKIEGHAQDMISCERCGIHVPIEEAVKENGKYYCSESHTGREKRQ